MCGCGEHQGCAHRLAMTLAVPQHHSMAPRRPRPTSLPRHHASPPCTPAPLTAATVMPRMPLALSCAMTRGSRQGRIMACGGGAVRCGGGGVVCGEEEEAQEHAGMQHQCAMTSHRRLSLMHSLLPFTAQLRSASRAHPVSPAPAPHTPPLPHLHAEEAAGGEGGQVTGDAVQRLVWSRRGGGAIAACNMAAAVRRTCPSSQQREGSSHVDSARRRHRRHCRRGIEQPTQASCTHPCTDLRCTHAMLRASWAAAVPLGLAACTEFSPAVNPGSYGDASDPQLLGVYLRDCCCGTTDMPAAMHATA